MPDLSGEHPTQDEVIDRIVREMDDVDALRFEGTVRGALADAYRAGALSVSAEHPSKDEREWTLRQFDLDTMHVAHELDVQAGRPDAAEGVVVVPKSRLAAVEAERDEWIAKEQEGARQEYVRRAESAEQQRDEAVRERDEAKNTGAKALRAYMREHPCYACESTFVRSALAALSDSEDQP